jgi:predicted acyltransferase
LWFLAPKSEFSGNVLSDFVTKRQKNLLSDGTFGITLFNIFEGDYYKISLTFYFMQKQIHTDKQSDRLASLDVLRGFDMFWIIGGGSLIVALSKALDWGWLNVVAEQMSHVRWEGFHFEDLIFPLFMFISGVAIPYAITARIEKGADKTALLKKAAKRGILLIILGILYNGALQKGFSTMRIPSVLGQIGIAYFFAATIVIFTNSMKSRVFWLTGILGSIAVLQLLVPVPGAGAGMLDPVNGINAYLDRLLIPGRLHGTTFDPEGLLCSISAISVTLMGALAGGILRDGNPASTKKVKILALVGASLIIAALLLSTFYPIIKAAWTVPFNLLTSGISCMLLSLFYLFIDVKPWANEWGWGIGSYKLFFFKVIGMNSITIYMASRIFDFRDAAAFFVGFLEPALGNWIIILGGITLEWLFLHFLYQKKVFLKV